MPVENPDVILAELDCLLDTRLGLLRSIDDKRITEQLLSGEYFSRLEDKFEGFPDFAEQYAKRTKDVLFYSVITEAINFLRSMIKQMVLTSFTTPFHKHVELHVNIAPYDLNEEEIDLIGSAIAKWFEGICSVKVVNIPLVELTPMYCKENVTAFMLYHYHHWVDTHKALLENPANCIPEVDLYAPGIYFVQKPSPEEMEKLIKTGCHPMEAVEKTTAPLVHLDLLSIRVFSVLNNLEIH